METQFFSPQPNFPINTLAISKHLRAHGYSEEQAEAQAELWTKITDASLVTKIDVENIRAELKRDIENLRAEVKRDIENLRVELKRDIAALGAKTERDIVALGSKTDLSIAALRADLEKMEYRLTIKLGAMLVVAITAISAIAKFL